MLDSASIAEPSTTSKTPYASNELPNSRSWATSVTTAPPRLCPISTMSGKVAHFMCALTAFTTKAKSAASVVRLKSWVEGELPDEVVVDVWP